MSIREMVLEGLLKLAKTTTKAIQLQVQVDEEDTADEVPLYQPQGYRVRPPIDAETILAAVGGQGEQPVALAAMDRETCPTDALEEGEGGMHYLGNWQVFMADDGTLSLGAKAGADSVACASKVDEEIQRIWDALTGWTVAPNDGGAALQTLANGPSGAPAVQSVASSKVKVEP